LAKQEAVDGLVAQERTDVRRVRDKVAVAARGDVRHARRRASVDDLPPGRRRNARSWGRGG